MTDYIQIMVNGFFSGIGAYLGTYYGQKAHVKIKKKITGENDEDNWKMV